MLLRPALITRRTRGLPSALGVRNNVGVTSRLVPNGYDLMSPEVVPGHLVHRVTAGNERGRSAAQRGQVWPGEKRHPLLRCVGDVDLITNGGGVKPAKPGIGGVGNGGVHRNPTQKVVTQAFRVKPQHIENDGVNLQQPLRIPCIVGCQIEDIRPAREDPVEHLPLAYPTRPAGQREPIAAPFNRHVRQIADKFPERMSLGIVGIRFRGGLGRARPARDG